MSESGMVMSDNRTILDKIFEDDENAKNKGYKAFSTYPSNRSKGVRFEITLADGRKYLCSYSYTGMAMFHPRGFLSFSSSHNGITIEGRNLEKLHELLLEEKLKGIHEFNPETDEEPGADEPMVTKVHIKSPLDLDPEAPNG